MLKAMHSRWLSGNLPAPVASQARPHVASGPADIDPAGNGVSAAAGPVDSAAMRAAMQEVLDKKLWPLEALLDEAVSECFCPMHRGM